MDRIWLRVAGMTAGILAAGIVTAAFTVLVGVAGYVAISDVSTPLVAGVAVGCGALILLACVVGGVYLVMRRPPVTVAPPDRLLSEIASMCGGELASAIRKRPTESALLCLAAGFAVGAVPGLRHGLLDILAKR